MAAEPAGVNGPQPGLVGCPPGAPEPGVDDDYARDVAEALGSPLDRWGEELLARPDGPTYDDVAGLLRPARWAIGQVPGAGTTESWTHYVPFGEPAGLDTRGGIALHVADGSQIVSNRLGSRGMLVLVGEQGEERFGECVANLDEPRLLDGYQPVLEVAYSDHGGVRYRQESFVTSFPGTAVLSSFVKITAHRAGSSAAGTRIRFDVCPCTLERHENRLVADGATHVVFGGEATASGGTLVYDLDLADGRERSVYVVRPISPSAVLPAAVPDDALHLRARRDSIAYWARRLSETATFTVPEPRVMDAQRNLLVQNMLMGRRYSLGNPYETFYQPESSDTVETLGRYGLLPFYRASLQALLPASKGRDRRNWEMGEKLLRAADYHWLTGDTAFVEANTPVYEAFAADLAGQHRRHPRGLLDRQRYSSDVADRIHGLHHISRAVLGLKAIVAVWRRTGRADLADRYGPVARTLDAALRRAIARSSVTLRDGSLFTSVALLERVRPYERLPATRLGGYWNLVAQYGFASKIYPPGSERARRTLAYLYDHGSRLLGIVRARAGGIADGYGVEQAKFLADNDQADQLVLSLYGNLAHGRARGTFVAGEIANVAPLAYRWPDRFGLCPPGEPCRRPALADAWSPMDAYRGLYNPPSSAGNTLFLSILRTMLVHELTDDAHVPQSLRLAFATPRGWLAHGKRITVRDAPTLFGPVSYTIDSALAGNVVTADVRLSAREAPPPVGLWLRTPGTKRMVAVTVNGRDHPRFDADRELVDLTGLGGDLRVRVTYG